CDGPFGCFSGLYAVFTWPDAAIEAARPDKRDMRSLAHANKNSSARRSGNGPTRPRQALDKPRPLNARLDEGGEKRMRIERPGFQFRVVLDPDEPRVIGDFHDFRKRAIRRGSGKFD